MNPSEEAIAREMAATGFGRLICIRRIQDRQKIQERKRHAR